jgi:hypothetical protein
VPIPISKFGLPFQGENGFLERYPWAMPTAKMELRFQREFNDGSSRKS